ncbi:hypothetical protein I4U23_002706 [Adineta vaga]|nr:hypothetical protein I4U23_002706 [Adineta vaga]
MQYENFSRHLREKYATRLHVADQLVDQLQYREQTQILPTTTYELNQRNIIKAQREISFPLISYLNKFEYEQSNSTEKHQEFEPYFNECILAAERIKNNRRSNRDRQICYENLVLTQKLERIKKQPTKKDYQDHRQLLISKVNHGQKSTQSRSSNMNQGKISSTIDTYQSLSLNKSESRSSVSTNEDDQATAADVDESMESFDLKSPVTYKQRKTSKFKCRQSKENNRVYQHLNNIDMTMIRDTIPLVKSPTPKHFSVCILPREKPAAIKVSSQHQKCAFKQEILYS